MAKIEIISVKGGSYFCSGRLSIGVYRYGDQVVLIDSGLENQTAKDVDKAIKAMGCKVAAIINTHSHADHCGGNAYFQNQYPGLKIYSTKYEKHYIEDPINEPRCFCKGAEPHSELRNKFLEAPASTVTHTIEPYQDQSIEIDGQSFSIISLPGHTPGMISVVTPDGVLYTGDAIFGDETLDKHGVLFYTNISDTLESFKKIETRQFEAVVFYHGGLMKGSLQAVTEKHAKLISDTKDKILGIVSSEAMSMQELTRRVMQEFKIPANPVQFTLTETCVNAYVAQLQKEKSAVLEMQDHLLVVRGQTPATLRA